MITSTQFIDRMATFERREQLEDYSGLRDVCAYIRVIPWWNRLLLCGYFRLRRYGHYVGYFEVYCGISGIFAKVEAEQAQKSIEAKEWQQAKRTLNWLLMAQCKDLLLALCLPRIRHKPSLCRLFWLRFSLFFR